MCNSSSQSFCLDVNKLEAYKNEATNHFTFKVEVQSPRKTEIADTLMLLCFKLWNTYFCVHSDCKT